MALRGVGIKFQSHRAGAQERCELFLEIDFSLKNPAENFCANTFELQKWFHRHFGTNSTGTFKASQNYR
jgi:hypothetical protein